MVDTATILLAVGLVVSLLGSYKLYRDLKGLRHDVRIFFDDWDDGKANATIIGDARVVFTDLLKVVEDAKTNPTAVDTTTPAPTTPPAA